MDLVYAPRDAVDALLENASNIGMKTDVITCRRRDNANLQPVNLLPQAKRRARRLDVKNLNLGLTALLAILVVAAITVPLVQKNRALEALEAQVQAAAAEAREGAALRQNLEKMASKSPAGVVRPSYARWRELRRARCACGATWSRRAGSNR